MNQSKQPGVYAIRNIDSGKTYVGSAKNLHHRWLGHQRALNAGTHVNSHLQRAWDKYGQDSFVFEILETCPLDCLLVTEQRHIDSVSADYRYNISPTAGSLLGYKYPPGSTKPEIREARRLRMLGNQRTKGCSLSDTHKALISARHKGKVLTQETRDRMAIAQGKVAEKKRAAMKGKPWTAARRAALTDGVRAKMSASQKGRPASEKQLKALDRGRRSRAGQPKPFMKRAPWSDARRAVMAAAIAARKSTEIVQ